MKKAWNEFKSFALGGNMVDLAIAFILGAAFTSVVQSLAKNVLLETVSALFGSKACTTTTAGTAADCTNAQPVINLRHGQIHLGAFLGDTLNFLIVAVLMFVLVKLLQKAKLGNFRTLNPRRCPYCKETVALDATRCRSCTSRLDALPHQPLPLSETATAPGDGVEQGADQLQGQAAEQADDDPVASTTRSVATEPAGGAATARRRWVRRR